MSDRQLARVWRLHPEYEAPDEDALIGDPGEWATGDVGEVVIRDPGGEAEKLPPLPMAIPKADGRGKLSLYFRSEEHTSELQSLMRNSYAVFCLKKTKNDYKSHMHSSN